MCGTKDMFGRIQIAVIVCREYMRDAAGNMARYEMNYTCGGEWVDMYALGAWETPIYYLALRNVPRCLNTKILPGPLPSYKL